MVYALFVDYGKHLSKALIYTYMIAGLRMKCSKWSH